ncbi:MAG: recombinase family protein [Chloroflexi bacterium]|nr:recombinase family protein [Chloroflexota bacterium]
MIAAIYVTESETTSSSCSAQEAACRAAAAAAGYEVVGGQVWREIRSGVTADRPQLDHMMAAVQKGQIDTIWVCAPACAIEIINRLHDIGIQPEVALTCERSDVINFLAAGRRAEQQRRAWAERSQRGKEAVAQQDRLPVGTIVFGYDYDASSKRRVVNFSEAVIVREIFDRVIAGEGLSRIAQDLNRRGVPTKRGDRWVGAAVKALVQRTSYYGVDYYGGSRRIGTGSTKSARVEVPHEEWVKIEGYSPTIVDRKIFEAAQNALRAQGRILPPNGRQSDGS